VVLNGQPPLEIPCYPQIEPSPFFSVKSVLPGRSRQPCGPAGATFAHVVLISKVLYYASVGRSAYHFF